MKDGNITLKDIQKQYGKRVKRKFALHIADWIDNAKAQKYIKKAIAGTLTTKDREWLWKMGKLQNSKMPCLNWLCTIYIHPLTKLEDLYCKTLKLAASNG